MKDFSQAILDSLLDNIAVINNNGIIIAVNKSWIDFSKENNGNTSNGYIGTNYLNVCPEEIKEGIRCVLNGEKTQFTFEYPCHTEQELRWFLLRVTPIRTENCINYGAVISHVNITERKLAELKLAHKEERYRLITENSTDFISIHTLDGVFTYASPICKLLLGYNPSELIGQSASDFFHPEDLGKFKQFHSLSFKKKEIQTITYRIRCKNNRYIWFETKYQFLSSSTKNNKEIICISRDITQQQLKIKQISKEKKLLQKAIFLDELTGVHNRRLFNKLLNTQFKEYYESNNDFSLLMIDIDYFKQYNDTYGHLEGDKCLTLVATTLKEHVREKDIVCRVGGEEFCVILPKTNKKDAITLANTLRQTVEQLNISHVSSTISPFITISIGVATISKNKFTKISGKELFSQADQALYKAKKSGKNKVIFYDCFYV
ncbi:sensor domain-containing diguanylate cyclase [Rummeliibacillus pycnus]|uniref:sensor domain-containing diguanylate cyclase n=1 Tax=Rummeliibacillus pycnus TaxID=101070 RepID=UPI000C99DDE9|nr:GGDEF domain-containing protein [Rummeliibacillus pycnus]